MRLFICFGIFPAFVACMDNCLTCIKGDMSVCLSYSTSASWNLRIEHIQLSPSFLSMSLSFSLLHLLIHPLGRTLGVRNGSRPSLGIKALLVSWLTLWWTHTHTHTLTQMYTLTLLAGFTTPCILLGLVLAGKLKDSLKDHLMDEAQRTCAGTRTDTSTPLFLVLSKACFVFSPADEGRWAARLKYFTVLDDRCKGWQGFIYLHIFQTALLLCPCTWLQPVVNTCYEGTEKERRETTSDAWVYTDTRHKDSNVNRYECIFFSLKHYHCSNEDHVEMLVTEEQGGSGLNKKRCILEITQDNNFFLFFFKLFLLEFWWE